MDETSSTKALAPVLERTLGRAGILTLNRPEAGNRLTPAMRASLATTLQRHERDREIYCTVLEAAQAAEGGSAAFCLGDDGEGYAGIADAAAGAWRIDRHGKPFVAMLRGPVAGAGLGLVLHGTHQVAGEAVTLAVPEVTAGTVPGAGLSLLLPDMPGQLGLFLALTGRPILTRRSRASF